MGLQQNYRMLRNVARQNALIEIGVVTFPKWPLNHQ
jgi:hypothetical protein